MDWYEGNAFNAYVQCLRHLRIEPVDGSHVTVTYDDKHSLTVERVSAATHYTAIQLHRLAW